MLSRKQANLFLPFPAHDSRISFLTRPTRRSIRQTAMGKRLYAAGLEVANLYAAFVWLSTRLLEAGGEIVAITPRSFCNGPYFKKFRIAFLNMVSLTRIHVFASRKKAFGDDDVLAGEYYLSRRPGGLGRRSPSVISTSDGLDFDKGHTLSVPYSRVVHPGDPDMFIHLDLDAADLGLAERMKCFTSSLGKLGLGVSTGRVVDFRAREYLRQSPEQGTVPLIYPYHFQYGFIDWPMESGKKTERHRVVGGDVRSSYRGGILRAHEKVLIEGTAETRHGGYL